MKTIPFVPLDLLKHNKWCRKVDCKTKCIMNHNYKERVSSVIGYGTSLCPITDEIVDLYNDDTWLIGEFEWLMLNATVAPTVERLICNQLVGCSSHPSGSNIAG